MKYLDLTLPTPEENLALDEALLERCESDPGEETLRFWEPQNYFVVLGYSNRLKKEVKLDSCRKDGIPVLKRITGGGAVLQGPGCLNYSLILRTDRDPAFRSIASTNLEILNRHREALLPVVGPVRIRGSTDLTLDSRKFSGNSQRRKRKALLYHGTFLLHFDLPLMERYLPLPSREPDYRAHRSHSDFLVNLGICPAAVKEMLRRCW